MPGFTEELVLLKPVWASRSDNSRYVASRTEIPGFWASRVDRSASLQIEGEAAVTEYDAIFRIRYVSEIEDIGPGWQIRDMAGHVFDVQRPSRVGTVNVDTQRIMKIDLGCASARSSRAVSP